MFTSTFVLGLNSLPHSERSILLYSLELFSSWIVCESVICHGTQKYFHVIWKGTFRVIIVGRTDRRKTRQKGTKKGEASRKEKVENRKFVSESRSLGQDGCGNCTILFYFGWLCPFGSHNHYKTTHGRRYRPSETSHTSPWLCFGEIKWTFHTDRLHSHRHFVYLPSQSTLTLYQLQLLIHEVVLINLFSSLFLLQKHEHLNSTSCLWKTKSSTLFTDKIGFNIIQQTIYYLIYCYLTCLFISLVPSILGMVTVEKEASCLCSDAMLT